MTSTKPAPESAAPASLPVVETLIAGDRVAEIVPAIGGSVAALYTAARGGTPRRDWLRPATAEALRGGSPLDMASFPLLPWCNRIRDGAFEWNGRPVELGPNIDGSPHTLHGIGWQRPWRVTARAEHWIELALDEPGTGAWPFAFEARQRYQLDADGLSVSLSLRNTGTESMPAGIGHHPYFPHRREEHGTTVRAHVEAMWQSDAEVMPTTLAAAHPAVMALCRGMPLAEFALDNNFTGFGHEAIVTWPDGSRLRLSGATPLDYFVLYCPADKDLFVIEAVSNCTDWINLRHRDSNAQVGGTALAPQATLAMQTHWMPLLPAEGDALSSAGAAG